MDLISPWGQVDRIAVLKAHIPYGRTVTISAKPVLWMWKNVSEPKMLGHSHSALPLAAAFDDVDVLRTDTNGVRVVFAPLHRRDQVHLWATR